MKPELVSYKYKQDSIWYDWSNWEESKAIIIHDTINNGKTMRVLIFLLI